MEERFSAAVSSCEDYTSEHVSGALREALDRIGGLGWVKPGMRVGIKANLVTAMRPETAAATHPMVVAELTKLLRERGAEVVVGDSPGGTFGAAYLAGVYSATGMKLAQEAGAELNRDFSTGTALCPENQILRQFAYTGWLKSCDAIVDVCKMKSHGLTGLSGAVKNLYGTIPGLVKTEYHYLHQELADFAGMLVELCEYWKPVLSVADAVEAMEGNGPTQGTPRHVGAIAVSASPYVLDMVLAYLMGRRPEEIPTVKVAMDRGLSPRTLEEVTVYGDIKALRVEDFQVVKGFHTVMSREGNHGVKLLVSIAAESILRPKPVLREGCVGCGHCARICPAKAITMKNKLPSIDRKKCIRCFCCQEFCPKGAMQVKRSAVGKLLMK